MDPDTQKLLERTRQRREILNQKIAGMPEAAPRKRRTPVLDSDGSEKVLSEKQVLDDDSPKRQCVRDVGIDIKPDTPAIRGVKSRVKDLPPSFTKENEENNIESTPTPMPRKSISSPPLERKAISSPVKSPIKQPASSSVTGTSRKSRFAALAQNINNWEDDLTHHVIQKEEEKKPRWQPPPKTDSIPPTTSGKGRAPPAPTATSSNVKATDPVSSPKKNHAPPTPRSNIPASPATNLARNSPLRTSKVEWNRSPKPYSPSYNDKASSVMSKTDLPSYTSNLKSESTVPHNRETTKCVITPSISSGTLITTHNDLPVNAPGLNESPPSDELNKTIDEPTLKPISQRFASWAERTETPKTKGAEPSRQPMSAKLANFEKKIADSTPKVGLASSLHVTKTPKQVCLPALSASTPAASTGGGACPKDSDPSELPVSQRMSQMQEKLTPRLQRKQDEPTAYSVGARMSAWENMTAANNVSNVKKVNPGEATPIANTPRPVSGYTPKPAVAVQGTPKAPPPPPVSGKAVTSNKSFKECIEEKASQVWSKKGVQVSSTSPFKSTPAKPVSPVKASITSPSKTVHSPSKVSAGTKTVQQRLAETCQSSNTTASALAAQNRAERLAELQAIQNRWKKGILKDDGSSDEGANQGKESNEVKNPETAPVIEQKAPGSARKEEIRTKARTDFSNKLAEIGLDGDPKNTPAHPPPPKGVASASKATPGSPAGGKTNSIYNLIKKREETAPQTNEETKKAQVKFNDSFDDSDDESDRKIPRSAAKRAAKQASVEEKDDFKKPLAPKSSDESESVANSSETGDEEFGSSDRLSLMVDDDDISLKGFVSEAVRRESILPSAAKRSSYSSLDSYDDDSVDPLSSKRNGYQPDEESMDETDDSNNRNAVDDLLDEAMDETSDEYDPDMDPNNVVLRRKVQHQEEEYDPDMDINNVQMRRKPNPTPRKVANNADSTDEDDRPYSLAAYRKSANVHQHVMEPIVRSSKYVGRQVEEEDIQMPTVQQPQRDDRRSVQDRIRELQELVQQEQNVIMQTSNALNKCCMGNSYFAGSAEQVECNRLLLIACQKRQCYMTEIQRLKETGMLSSEGPGPQGSLTISDIRLPLKKDFVTKIGTSQDNTTHYFILLIRNGSQLICTQMLSTHDPMMRGSLDFPNLIKINGITANFKLTLDIYSMSVSKEMASKDKKRKTPKKGKGYAMGLESPGGPLAVRTTSFSHVTSLQLTMKNLDKSSFHLDRLPVLSPLFGQIFMRLKCLMEVSVEERGFLTMFDDVSGFGAWHRRWCVLARNKLCIWKYPDDENRKDPMAIIDLKRCITERVGLVPRDICARPNTFEMVTVRQPLKGEHDTLVTRTYNSTTTVRHQMSADSKEERIVWCNKINRALANLRTWNADALKPVKQSSASTSSYRH